MKIVIVGGGFGGVKAALLLNKQHDADITVISKSVNFQYHAALYRSATGRSPREVVIPLSTIFEDDAHVSLVQAEVTQIDPQHKRVVSETGQEFHYDYLILSVGQEINYFGIEGLEENSYSLDTIANTIALREHIREVVADAGKHQPHFAIVGAGASGVELSAELNIFANKIAQKQGLKPKQFKVSLIEGADRVLPLLKEKISVRAGAKLKSLGVNLMLGQKVMSASHNKLKLESGELEADAIIWTAGNRNNRIFAEHEHLFEFARNGRVSVDEHLEARRDVYVIGDSANTQYSGMAQTALHDAQYVAQDIADRSAGRNRQPYKSRIPIYVVPVGPQYAVFQSKHLMLYGYPAWLLRRAADFRLFSNFEPLKAAIKTWRKGNQSAIDY